MKKLLLLAFLFCALNLPAQISWYGPLTVVTGSTYGNLYPRLNLVTGSKPLITWGKSSGEVFSSVLNTSVFSAPVQISPAGVTGYIQTWTGPETASSGDTVYTAWSTSPAGTGKIYMVRSVDAGTTFSDTVRVEDIDTNYGWIPSIAVLPGGNPIVSYMRHDAGYDSVDYVTKKSLDGGLTFQPVVNASAMSPGVVCDCCPSSIVSRGNNVVQIFRNAGSNIRTMYGAFSSDEGTFFTAVNEIDLTGWTTGVCPSSGPSGVIVGDSLIYVWMSKAGGPTRIYMGTVNIYDQQIGINRQVFPTTSGTQNFPVIAAKGDTVVVAWEHNSAGVTDISLSYSLTGAAGIGNVVDTLTNTMAGNQTRPDIAFNNRKFHVSFSDASGTAVKYLEGIIGSEVGITSAETSIQTNLVHAFYTEAEGLVVTVESPIEQEITLMVFDASGRNLKNKTVMVMPGRGTYYLQGTVNTGTLYVKMITADGKSSKAASVVITK